MFENSKHIPLAERCRPEKLDDFIGQEHVVSDGKIISTMIEKGNVFSLIFWAIPGPVKLPWQNSLQIPVQWIPIF